MVKLSMSRARTFCSLYANPPTADSVNALEDLYKEILVAIGNGGRLTRTFMVVLDRTFSSGIYTLCYRLSVYVNSEMMIDVGLITGAYLREEELYLHVKDGLEEFKVVLSAAGAGP